MQINVAFESFEEMREFAKKMAGTRRNLTSLPQGNEAEKTKRQDTSPAEETPAAPEEETPAEEPVKEEAAVYTLVDVRTKLGALTKAGKKAQVQELIKSFGVDKLSQIPEEKYEEVMQKAGEL